MIILISLLITLITLVYIFLTWNYDYWQKRGIPGPKPKLVFGSFAESTKQKKHYANEIEEIYKEYKNKTPAVGLFSARSPRLLIIDAKLAKNILTQDFKSFGINEFSQLLNQKKDPIFGRNPFLLNGEAWKEKRAEITPAFTLSRIKSMYTIVQHVQQKMTTYVQTEIDDKSSECFDAKELASKFTIDVVSNCIYGVDSRAFSDPHSIIREMGGKLFEPSRWLVLYMAAASLIPSFQKIYQLKFCKQETESFFINLLRDAIKLRKSTNTDQHDYLNYLLELQKKKNISDLDMAAHTITFFLDGFETSSMVISHILLELGRHPNVQAKLRSEIREKIDKNGSISFEDLNELEYLDQVFNETMRLYLIGGSLNKVCTANTEFIDYKNRKHCIERGTIVLLPIGAIHTDPEFYPNPLEFRPERFENDALKTYRDNGLYFPFGDGPRQCLGMRFAQMQVKASIVELVNNFTISINAKTHDRYVLDPKQFFGAPIGGIWIDLKKIH